MMIGGLLTSLIPAIAGGIGGKKEKKAAKAEEAKAAQEASANNGNEVKIAKADLDALIQKAAASQVSAVPGQSSLRA